MLKEGLKGSTVHTRFKWTGRPSYKVIDSAEVAMVTGSMLKNSPFFPVLHSFSTLLWCLCMWGPPSRAAVHSSGPFSSASHSKAATELSAPLWNGCFPPRGSKRKRGKSTPRSRRTLHRTEVCWPRRDKQRWFCGRCLLITGVRVTPLGALGCNFLFNTALQERIAAMVTVVWCSRLPLLTYSCKTGMCKGRNCLHGVQWQLFHQHLLWFILSERCTTTQLSIIYT